MRVVNIMNFVRAVEPRLEMDLLTPVKEEIKLNKKYGFENTFLLQYDVIINNDFVEIFKAEKDEKMELGVWIEVVRPLVDAVGLPWRGNEEWTWDWHVNPDFLMAYTEVEKRMIIDEVMAKFKEVFGEYPKSVGSWLLDSYSVDYMANKYDIDAFCICREQYGTDGYTLWGGYYNGPYYPCKNNILSPAQSGENQINTPVIRLLGPDPIYCYYERQKRYNKMENTLFTLEPTWGCGQDDKWIDWYYNVIAENENLGVSYAQSGQENSFGWETIKEGLPKQLEILAKHEREGKIQVKKVCDTGRMFKEKYSMTPPTVYQSLEDWAELGNQSIWYNCKNYRVNIFNMEGEISIRDIHKFDENYRDAYLDNPCMTESCTLDTLPVVDSVRFSDDEARCGIYFGNGKIESSEKINDNELLVTLTADDEVLKVTLSETGIYVEGEKDFELEFKYKKRTEQIQEICEKHIDYCHNGMNYKMVLDKGTVENKKMKSENSEIVIKFK